MSKAKWIQATRRPKILVDTIRTEIKILEFLDNPPRFIEDEKPRPTAFTSVPISNGVIKSIKSAPAPVRQTAEMVHPYTSHQDPTDVSSSEISNMPPPPDNFPVGWDAEWQPSFEAAQIAARPEVLPVTKIDESHIMPASYVEPPPNQTDTEFEPDHVLPEILQKPQKILAIQPIETVPVEPPSMPSLYLPIAKEEKDKDHPPKQITVLLRSSGDREHDNRRIKTIYGTLISFHGRDRFSFQIFESGKGHLIDFPNDTTRLCPEMLARLLKLMGEESWRIEEITFQ